MDGRSKRTATTAAASRGQTEGVTGITHWTFSLTIA